jgi:hypothetical protein
MSLNRMFIAEGRVFGLNSSRSPINMCPKASRYKNMGITRLLTELFRVNEFSPCVHQGPRHYGAVDHQEATSIWRTTFCKWLIAFQLLASARYPIELVAVGYRCGEPFTTYSVPLSTTAYIARVVSQLALGKPTAP